MNHSITSAVTVTAMTTDNSKPYKNPNDVSFKVNYSEDYKGRKNWPVGEVLTVSKEVAEDFTKRGIGSVVTDETIETKEPVEVVQTSEPTQTIPDPLPETSEETTVSKEVAEDKPGKKGKK